MDLTRSVKMDAPLCVHGGVNISTVCVCSTGRLAIQQLFYCPLVVGLTKHFHYFWHVHFNCIIDSKEYCVFYLI